MNIRTFIDRPILSGVISVLILIVGLIALLQLPLLVGCELGGGSIRIHNPKVQERMFQIIGIGPEEMQRKFGFLINAFKYGAPPHGGLAFGLDRVCALFGGADTIRDYIAFPKNNQGKDIMLGAPSIIDTKQLDELHLDLRPVE